MNTQPRVLIDATAIPASLGGVGRYLEHLVPALDQNGTQLVIAVQERDRRWIADAAPGAEVVALSRRWAARGARLLWEQIGLPAMARRTRCDVIHSPHYTFPLITRRLRVVTLHDATFFSDPSVHSALKAAFFRVWTRLALRCAQQLVVPSEATRSELVRLVGARAARARVAYHGGVPSARPGARAPGPTADRRRALDRIPGDSRAAQERARADPGLSRRRGRSARRLRGRSTRDRRSIGMGRRRGWRRRPERQSPPSRLRRQGAAAGPARRRRCRRLPVVRGGLRSPRAGGDGVRRRRAHHAASRSARGRRGGGRVHGAD